MRIDNPWFALLRAAGSAKDVADLVYPVIGDETIEVFASLLLDTKNRISGYAEVSRGTLTSSLVHPREVFGPALRQSAASIVVTHNHPSGDPTPSLEDIEVTNRLRDSGYLLGVPLLDHVIVGATGRFESLRERFRWSADIR